MANKSVAANSLNGYPSTERNVGSYEAKNTPKTEMEVADFSFLAAKTTKKTEMELVDLMNADLTTWKTQEKLLKLKLKSTGTKAELVDRLRIFQENTKLLEKQLNDIKQNLCISHKFGRVRSSSTNLCLERRSIIESQGRFQHAISIHWLQETR